MHCRKGQKSKRFCWRPPPLSAQILAGWTKNVKSKKCKVFSIHPRRGPPPPWPSVSEAGIRAGPHIGGGWKRLYIFWTSHFFGQPAKIWAELPLSARVGQKTGVFGRHERKNFRAEFRLSARKGI